MTSLNIILLIIGTCLFFVVYLLGIYANFGVLKSISDSYYKLYHIKRGWLFRFFIFAVAISMAIIGHHPVIYIASGFLSLVGIYSMFKDEKWKTDKRDEFENKVHIVGATGSIIIGFIYLTFFLKIYWIAFPTILFLVFASPKKTRLPWLNGINNYTWWIETVAFFNIMFGFLIKNL